MRARIIPVCIVLFVFLCLSGCFSLAGLMPASRDGSINGSAGSAAADSEIGSEDVFESDDSVTDSEVNFDVEPTINNSGSVAGVWMGTYIPYGQYSPEFRYLLMYEDGSFFHDMPWEGLAGFETMQSRMDENSKDYWGYYMIDGNKGTWDYHSADGSSISEIDIKSINELVFGVNHYYRCGEVDALRLDGSWTTYADSSDPDLKRGGIQPIIRFTPDGRFVDEGLFQKGFSFLEYSEGESSIAPGQGTYDIENFTLKLRYDDGRERNTAFSLLFNSQKQQNPEFIFVYRVNLSKMQ